LGRHIGRSVLQIAGGVMMLQRRELRWWILAFGIAIGILTDLRHVALLTLVITLLIAYIHMEARPQYRNGMTIPSPES